MDGKGTGGIARAEAAGRAGWARYPLLDALRERRSRRFAAGMRLAGEPLAHESARPPEPLSEEEEAILAFAACGITGPVLADWDWGGGGNMMAGVVGRTIGSADAISSVALLVINDEGAWLMKRPRDFPAAEIPELTALAAAGEFLELWRRCRVRVSEGRCVPPLEPPGNLLANRWSLHSPGTTYFLPVGDVTLLYINVMLEMLNEEEALFMLDERAYYRPAGCAGFARSKGGHLEDDPRANKAATIASGEQLIAEMIAIESGMLLQNLGLTCQALGLGGFPHYAGQDWDWFAALGFRTEEMPVSRYFGMPRPIRWLLRARGQDNALAYPLGLEREGRVLLRPFCPPYYGSMTEAVRAVADLKFGAQGLYRGGMANTAWREPQAVAREIPPISERAVAATAAYCEYVWKRYGRFPAYLPPFHVVMGFQAHHLDLDFYDRHYQPGALGERHRRHREQWH